MYRTTNTEMTANANMNTNTDASTDAVNRMNQMLQKLEEQSISVDLLSSMSQQLSASDTSLFLSVLHDYLHTLHWCLILPSNLLKFVSFLLSRSDYPPPPPPSSTTNSSNGMPPNSSNNNSKFSRSMIRILFHTLADIDSIALSSPPALSASASASSSSSLSSNGCRTTDRVDAHREALVSAFISPEVVDIGAAGIIPNRLARYAMRTILRTLPNCDSNGSTVFLAGYYTIVFALSNTKAGFDSLCHMTRKSITALMHPDYESAAAASASASPDADIMSDTGGVNNKNLLSLLSKACLYSRLVCSWLTCSCCVNLLLAYECACAFLNCSWPLLFPTVLAAVQLPKPYSRLGQLCWTGYLLRLNHL